MLMNRANHAMTVAADGVVSLFMFPPCWVLRPFRTPQAPIVIASAPELLMALRRRVDYSMWTQQQPRRQRHRRYVSAESRPYSLDCVGGCSRAGLLLEHGTSPVRSSGQACRGLTPEPMQPGAKARPPTRCTQSRTSLRQVQTQMVTFQLRSHITRKG